MENTARSSGMGQKILLAAGIVIGAAAFISLFLWWVYSLR